MNILGLYWGLGSTAALFQDDGIVGAVGEERFTRTKNDDAFPAQSVSHLLKSRNLNADDLDIIAIASKKQNLLELLKRPSRWSIQDYVRQQSDFWGPRLLESKDIDEADLWRDRLDYGVVPIEGYVTESNFEQRRETWSEDRIEVVSRVYDVPAERIRLIDHHQAHAFYTYYASHFRGRETLCLTIDAHGDGLNATVSIFDEQGRYKRVFETANCHIARIYRYITLLLGMKPNEHEYKLMGLAPYGKGRVVERPYEIFKETLYVDGMDFKWNIKPTDSYYYFRERFEGCRFDGIAAALQTWVEELLMTWVENVVRETGVGNVVMSGGVAMNVKANGRVAALDCVDDFFVGGTGSDECLALGSTLVAAAESYQERDSGWTSASIRDLESLNLGPTASREQEEAAAAALDDAKYVTSPADPAEAAALLAGGLVLARCAGPMEFGQRALGNRSIIADPIDPEVVPRINAMIKNRDFWMPFAPMVLDEFAPGYIKNPKNLRSPHMTVAFEATEEGFRAMRAGCHPADRTVRAQILTRTQNPEMYELLSAFQKRTGRAALLNTSFNLHGFPIVNTPAEATDVLENSGLDGVVMNHLIVVKREALERSREKQTAAARS